MHSENATHHIQQFTENAMRSNTPQQGLAALAIVAHIYAHQHVILSRL